MARATTALSLCLVAIVACSREPAASPPPSAPPVSHSGAKPALDLAACLTRADDRDPQTADSIAVVGDAIHFCFGVQPHRSCWRFDMATQVFTPQRVIPPPPESAPKLARPPHATAEVGDDGNIKLCGPRGSPCQSFRYDRPVADITHQDCVAVSDDLSTLTVPEYPALRVYDVATGKLRAAIHGWRDSPMGGGEFNSATTFATPQRMIVWDSWTPVSNQGRIFDMSGRQIAIIGHDFDVIGGGDDAWPLAGTEWAFAGEGNHVMTVDVQAPTVTSMYDISALLALPRPPPGSDNGFIDVFAIAGTRERLIIVTGENPVTIGVLDRTTKKLVKLEPPRCSPVR